MYPGIALFYPELARALLRYRVATIEGAKYNAQKQGYKVGWPVGTQLEYWPQLGFGIPTQAVSTGTEVPLGERGIREGGVSG